MAPVATGSALHARGAHGDAVLVLDVGGISPARAGSDDLCACAGGPGWGSAPDARGALRPTAVPAGSVGISPARAGSTRCPRRSRTRPRDQPRTRGEHSTACATRYASAGSAPHVRGAHLGNLLVTLPCGISPARAGSTTSSAPAACSPRDQPGTSGEHVSSRAGMTNWPGSAPHLQGVNHRAVQRVLPAGISPVRGEHLAAVHNRTAELGSAPHLGEHSSSASATISSSGSPRTRGERRSSTLTG